MSMQKLEKEIHQFFGEKCEEYLQALIQHVLKRESSKREVAQILNQFIEEAQMSFMGYQHFQGYLKPVERWKKEFTQKILIPKYLSKNEPISLEIIIDIIKQTLIKTAIDIKIAFYQTLCKHQLFNELQSIIPKDRLRHAKLILNQTLHDIEKEDPIFKLNDSKNSFDSLLLIENLQTIPYLSQKELVTHELDAYLTNYLENLLKACPKTFMHTLTIINKEIALFQKNAEYYLQNIGINIKYHHDVLQFLIQKKSDILAYYCYQELKEAQKDLFYEDKVGQKIKNKYLTYYLHESDPFYQKIKERFIFNLNNQIAKAEKAALDEPQIPLVSKKPKRTSFWKKI